MGKMAIQHIRHYILTQLGTSGVSLVWGANVIARLGDDLENIADVTSLLRQEVCPLTKIATAVG